jgi:hypothetical protein
MTATGLNVIDSDGDPSCTLLYDWVLTETMLDELLSCF